MHLYRPVAHVDLGDHLACCSISGACHSLDYILMNSVFLDEKGWTAEVTKMVKTFGAPVEEADQQQIIAYLVESYCKPPG